MYKGLWTHSLHCSEFVELTLFITSNRFREDLPQCSNILTYTLPTPTADTLEIINMAITILKDIYIWLFQNLD